MAVSRRRIRSSAWLVGALGIGLVVSGGGMPAVSSAAAAQGFSALSSADETNLSGTDLAPAMAAALASGKRIEDEAQRNEFTRVYANPDGTWTSETASSPESVQDESGTWHELDPTLMEDGGRLAPKYGLSPVTISAGGDKVFATMSEEGHDLAWQWPTVLPEPVVDGASATYVGVAAGGIGDLVVTATDGGFSYNVVLHEEPTEPVEVAVPVITDGGVLKETQDGGLAVITNDGGPVVEAPEPVMFDASTDDAGDPTNVATVDAEVDKSGTGAPVLTLLPDEDFLHDSDTVYPVTVDPTFAPLYSSDTWIQTPDLANAQTGSQELRVGSKDAGAHKARAFMHFGGTTNPWAGMAIDSASLVLRNFDSGSCANGAIRASMISQDWGAGISWPGPSVSASYDKDYAPALGYSASCPAADAAWDVTAMVRQWAGGVANNGIRLAAVDAAASNTYRRYRSANYQNYPGLRPHLNVTYNNPPARIGVTPAVWYQPASGDAMAYASTMYPTLKAQAIDADSTMLHFEVRATPTGPVVSTCDSSNVSPSTVTLCQVTTILPNNSTFIWRVKAKDADSWAGGSIDADAGWSSWGYVRIAATVPAAPQINCGAGYPNGSVGIDRPPTALSCTVSAPAGIYSAPAYIRWSVDGGAQNLTAITQSADPSIARTTVSVPNTVGSHSIVATAESPSGLSSTQASYSTTFKEIQSALIPAPPCGTGCAPIGPTTVYDSATDGMLPAGQTKLIPLAAFLPQPDVVSDVRFTIQVTGWAGSGSLRIYNPDFTKPVYPSMLITGGDDPSLGKMASGLVEQSVSGNAIAISNDTGAGIAIRVQLTGVDTWFDATEADLDGAEENPGDDENVDEGSGIGEESQDVEFAPSKSQAESLGFADGVPSSALVASRTAAGEDSCQVDEAGDYEMCIDFMTQAQYEAEIEAELADMTPVEKGRIAYSASTDAALAAPVTCASTGRWSSGTRYKSCRKLFATVMIFNQKTGSQVGKAKFTVSETAEVSRLSTEIRRTLTLRWSLGRGVGEAGIGGVFDRTCAECTAVAPDPKPWSVGPIDKTTTYTFVEHGKTKGNDEPWSVLHGISMRTTTPAQFHFGSVQLFSPTFRCDNASYFSGPGCVILDFVPTFYMSSNSLWAAAPQTASHIGAAISGGYRSLLHRAYSGTAKRPNRNAAIRQCNAQRRYSGETGSCDEYPFASTYEGCAAYICSTRLIDLSDNRRGGSLLGGFYRRQRLMTSAGGNYHGDAFKVKIRN